MAVKLPLGDELARVFARMSGVLLSAETVETALRLVATLATETIAGSVGAGVSVSDSRGRRTTAGSDPVVETADSLQYSLDEGPCLQAAATRELVRVDDVASDGRWPRWTAAAGALGLRSVLSAPLVAGGDSFGAIKVYSLSSCTFSESEERRLELFAAQAAILLANMQSYDTAQRLSEGLQDALRNRDVIGQAKGILMERHKLIANQAFELLVGASQRTHRKLHDVAEELAATGAVPT